MYDVAVRQDIAVGGEDDTGPRALAAAVVTTTSGPDTDDRRAHRVNDRDDGLRIRIKQTCIVVRALPNGTIWLVRPGRDDVDHTRHNAPCSRGCARVLRRFPDALWTSS